MERLRTRDLGAKLDSPAPCLNTMAFSTSKDLSAIDCDDFDVVDKVEQ